MPLAQSINCMLLLTLIQNRVYYYNIEFISLNLSKFLSTTSNLDAQYLDKVVVLK